MVVREETYQEIEEHFVDLINDPNVDGVFEQQVSILLLDIISLDHLSFLAIGSTRCTSTSQIRQDLHR